MYFIKFCKPSRGQKKPRKPETKTGTHLVDLVRHELEDQRPKKSIPILRALSNLPTPNPLSPLFPNLSLYTLTYPPALMPNR